jgi:hypothetical protein
MVTTTAGRGDGTPVPENAMRLFDLYAGDAGNWSGAPLVGGNVGLLGEREDRGLLTWLK